MMKAFFNRSSPILYVVNLVVLVEILTLVYVAQGQDPFRTLGWVSYLLIFSWVYFNLLCLVPWYPRHKGALGIRLHFQKNLVPVVYLSAIGFALIGAGVSEGILALILVMYLPMYYVSFMLMGFHFRDNSDLVPSYFSQNFYLKNKVNAHETPSDFRSRPRGDYTFIAGSADRIRGQ